MHLLLVGACQVHRLQQQNPLHTVVSIIILYSGGTQHRRRKVQSTANGKIIMAAQKRSKGWWTASPLSTSSSSLPSNGFSDDVVNKVTTCHKKPKLNHNHSDYSRSDGDNVDDNVVRGFFASGSLRRRMFAWDTARNSSSTKTVSFSNKHHRHWHH